MDLNSSQEKPLNPLINLKQEQIIKSITTLQQNNQIEQSNQNHLADPQPKNTIAKKHVCTEFKSLLGLNRIYIFTTKKKKKKKKK